MSLKINGSMSMRPHHVPPSAWTGHIPFAAWIVEEARPELLVELGTHHGTSYLAFCQAVARNNLPTRCAAVDTWQGDEHAGHYDDSVFEALSKYHAGRYASFSQLMRMTFEEGAKYFSDGSIDLLHIDGLHTYEAVKADFETWLPKMSRRGVILFHDIEVRERGFGVWRLWQELSTAYRSFAFTHTHGLGVLLVGEEQPDSLEAVAALTGTPDAAICNALFSRLGDAVRFGAEAENLARMLAESSAAVTALHGKLGEAEVRAHESATAAMQAQAERKSERSAFEAHLAEVVARAEAAERGLGEANHRIEAMVASLESAATRAGMAEGRLAEVVQELEQVNQKAAQAFETVQRQASELTEQATRQTALETRLAELVGSEQALMHQLGQLGGRIVELEASAREQASRLAESTAEREAQRRQLFELASVLASHAGEPPVDGASLESAFARRLQELDEAHGEIDRLAAQAEERDARMRRLQGELERVTSSRSWRVTAPLRWISTKLLGAQNA